LWRAPLFLRRLEIRTPHVSTHVDVVRGDLTLERLDSCLQEIDTVILVWVVPTRSNARSRECEACAARIGRLIEQSGFEWTFVGPACSPVTRGISGGRRFALVA
jgi:hypothetical protein